MFHWNQYLVLHRGAQGTGAFELSFKLFILFISSLFTMFRQDTIIETEKPESLFSKNTGNNLSNIIKQTC